MPTTRASTRKAERISFLSPLERLPLHIVELIVEQLEHRSLRAFSQVNRVCYSASERQRFRCIRLDIVSGKRLRKDITRWQRVLRRGNRHRHVRILRLTGRMGSDGRKVSPVEEGDDDQCIDLCTPPKAPIAFSRTRGTPTKRSLQAWDPLAGWIKDFPGLSDVVHGCSDQIAPSIISAINEHHRPGRLRLHMHAFSLRSLVRPKHDLSPMSRDDWAIATSPCLYSIVLRHHSWVLSTEHHQTYLPGMSRYNTDANLKFVARMISGLAPNLSVVQLQQDRHGRPRGMPDTYRFFDGLPPAPLEAYIPQLCEPLSYSRSASVRRLTMSYLGLHHMPGTLSYLYRDADFAGVFHSLESLVLLRPEMRTLSETWETMGPDVFPSLRSLQWEIKVRPNDYTEVFDRAVCRVINSLPLLQELVVSGYMSELAYKTIRGRSSLLRKLHITSQRANKGTRESRSRTVALAEMTEHFPDVQDLRLIS